MKTFIICDKNNNISFTAAKKCQQSLIKTNSNVEIEFFQQTSPNTIEQDLEIFLQEIPLTQLAYLKWNYPGNNESKIDLETGMRVPGYRAIDQSKVFACLVSHIRLWYKSVELDQEIMILEHDAIFTRKFAQFNWKGGVLGLNDPRGATHTSMLYHQLVSRSKGIHDAPWVKPRLDIPQGLAGNSAYIIKPNFAQRLLNKLLEKGGWPNDAIMCKQFFQEELKVVYPYYTTLQGIQSTTTL